MRVELRQMWPVVKVLLGVAIIAGVGWQFASILQRPELWQRPLHLRPQWLLAAALLYLLGHGFPAFFWYRLLRTLGERPSVPALVRAYYIGHLGKYVPGKAWAVILRATLVREAGVRTGTAALTAAYETLTTMSAGALLAVILFALQKSDHAGMGWKALGLLALAGIPILPGVFNWLVRRLAALPSRAAGQQGSETAPTPLPPLRATTLLGGLALTACDWVLLGASLSALIQAVLPEAPPWTWETWSRYTAFVALAYVAGFLALPAPGGLGVRELILQQFLTPELAQTLGAEQADAMAVVVVLLLRLLWTAAEMIMAGAVYWLPVRSQGSGVRSQESGVRSQELPRVPGSDS